MKRKRFTPLVLAGLVSLLTAAAGCGGGGSGDDDDTTMIDSGTTIDSGMVDIDAAVSIDSGDIIDAAPIDAPTPDAFVQVGLPKLQLVQGSGILRVQGGGRTLNALFGQPLVRPFNVPGGNRIEPGLMPQTRVP